MKFRIIVSLLFICIIEAACLTGCGRDNDIVIVQPVIESVSGNGDESNVQDADGGDIAGKDEISDKTTDSNKGNISDRNNSDGKSTHDTKKAPDKTNIADNTKGTDKNTPSNGESDETINREDNIMETGDITTGKVPDNLYAKDELICLADTEEDARNIASLYGITLYSYNCGVAVFKTNEDPVSVIKRGKANGYPDLELNHIVTIKSSPDGPK